MIVIAARPAMGKTAFVLSMARNMAVKYKQGVAVVFLEVFQVQVGNRFVGLENEVWGGKNKTGKPVLY